MRYILVCAKDALVRHPDKFVTHKWYYEKWKTVKYTHANYFTHSEAINANNFLVLFAN
jgi:hypothetical protein